MENSKHVVVVVGAGVFGSKHINALSKHEAINERVRVAAIVDTDPQALLNQIGKTSSALYWNVSTATKAQQQTYKNLTPEDQALITPIESVADVIRLEEANTLVNATSTPSHISVLEDALSVRDLAQIPLITTIFQEKPIAEHLADAQEIAQTVRDHNIRFCVNSVLAFSPVWGTFDYFHEKAKNEGFELISVDCSYGKNRTNDTRPATNGWTGMDGFHPLDIIGRVVDEKIDINYSKGHHGFLAEKASEDGHVMHSYECEGYAGDVELRLEGSFAWDEQVRRVQFYYQSEDDDSVEQQCIELNFDYMEDGVRRDGVAHYSDYGRDKMLLRSSSGFDDETEREINGVRLIPDKLFRYYENGFSGNPVVCDLDKALAHQQTLETMMAPNEVIYLDAQYMPAQPELETLKADETFSHDYNAPKKRSWKTWPLRNPIKATFALAVAMQLTPELATQDSADYLQDNDYPEILAEHFDTDEIRIYGRYNPLSSLHFIGRPVGLHFENLPEDDMDKLKDTVGATLSMFVTGFMAVSSYIPPYTAADAFAVPNENGTCFIRPPSNDLYLNRIINLFTGIPKFEDFTDLNLKNDVADIEDAFEMMIMAHEMRHCEQPRDLPAGNMNESDADIVAIRLLGEAGYSEVLVREVYQLYTSLRLIGALGGHEAHDTGLNILSGNTVSLYSYKALAAQRILTDLADGILAHQEYPEDMIKGEQRFHTIKALRSGGILDEFDDETREFADRYIRAYHYLNGVSNGRILDDSEYYKQIDTDYLRQDITQETIPSILDFGYEF